MKLQAKVTETISGSESRDGQQRVKLKVEGADSMFRALIVPNTDGLSLDDGVVLLVLTKQQAAYVYKGLDPGGWGDERVEAFLDQLRPDPPVPWEQPTGHDDPERQFSAQVGA